MEQSNGDIESPSFNLAQIWAYSDELRSFSSGGCFGRFRCPAWQELTWSVFRCRKNRNPRLLRKSLYWLGRNDDRRVRGGLFKLWELLHGESSPMIHTALPPPFKPAFD